MTQHAKYSPSSSYRWIPCPASVRFQSPSGEDHEAAGVGVELHRYSELRLLGQLEADPENPAEPYVRAVQALPGVLTVEGYLGDEILGGTPDALLVAPEALHVVDLKTGRCFVPSDTPQLGIYLLLARAKYGRRESYFATIVQPICGTDARTHTWTNADLDKLEADVALAQLQDTTFKAGPHCSYCPLVGNCVPSQHYIHEEDFADEDLVTMGKIFERNVEMAKDRLIAKLESGVDIPGFRVSNRKTARYWADDAEAYLKEHPELFQLTPVTPAAAEKIIGADLPGGLTKVTEYKVLVEQDQAKLFSKIDELP